MLVVSTATVFGRVLTLMQAPQAIAAGIMATFHSKIMILLIINIFLLFVGMIMETIAAILILTPIFLPIIAALGIDPIHFGVIMTVNLAIGFVTPPVGVNLYVASGMTGIPVMKIARKALPFIIAFYIALLIITYVPWFSMALVS
jgi:C4-dicarboxylate transporter DctM subunit